MPMNTEIFPRPTQYEARSAVKFTWKSSHAALQESNTESASQQERINSTLAGSRSPLSMALCTFLLCNAARHQQTGGRYASTIMLSISVLTGSGNSWSSQADARL